MNIKIKNIIDKCTSNIYSKSFKSYDIFDALTSKGINFLTMNSQLLKRVAIQINAKSPINFRCWLGMRPLQHTKTISDSLWYLSLLHTEGFSSRQQLDDTYSLLIAKGSKGRKVWGLNFKYATRFIDADENMPNLYNTCTSGIAISHYCEVTGSHIEDLKSIYYDLNSTFSFIEESNSKGYYIYYPTQRHPTYNVNALALYFFSRINFVSKEEVVPKKRIDHILNLIIDEQLENGGWYYSRSENGKWIDGFHTGFIIESLIYTYKFNNTNKKLKNCIDRAIYYFKTNMFTDDHYPKYFDYSDKYPIEAQNCAQAIQTLEAIVQYENESNTELLDKVVANTIKDLYSNKGFFYYKKEKFYTIKNSYLRWSTAPMLVALSYYLKLKTNEKD